VKFITDFLVVFCIEYGLIKFKLHIIYLINLINIF